MKRKRLLMKVAILLLIAAAAGATALFWEYLPSVQHLGMHRERLLLLIRAHYLEAVLLFVLLYFTTAFFLPGALALTLAGGMMFGAVPGAIYANLAGTFGAVAAFGAARFVIGHWVQRHFAGQLARFNREMARHGPNYLLTLRLLPLAPFFVINYSAALTRIPLRTFVWTTSVGMLPGSLIYSFVGEQLRHLGAFSDLASQEILLSLSLMGLLSLLPVVVSHLAASRTGGR